MKRPFSIRNRIPMLTACAASLLWPTLAMAAAPPEPVLNRGAPIWLGYLVMFVLLLGVVLVSLMPSKRGHQD